MPANRVSFLAENSGTGSHLLRLYAGTDMSIEASFPGQVRFLVKNKSSHNRALGAPKGNNQGTYGPSCVPHLLVKTANRTRNRRQDFHNNSQYLVTSQQNFDRTLQSMKKDNEDFSSVDTMPDLLPGQVLCFQHYIPGQDQKFCSSRHIPVVLPQGRPPGVVLSHWPFRQSKDKGSWNQVGCDALTFIPNIKWPSFQIQYLKSRQKITAPAPLNSSKALK